MHSPDKNQPARFAQFESSSGGVAAAATHADSGESTTSIQTVAFASAIGCVIEWYDFFLYGVAANLVFNKLFFSQENPALALLLSNVLFAAGFVSRPLGGVIFGHYGDRLGRKAILVLTLLIMGVATFAIGLVPTYASIGVAAPIILVCLRVLQGIGIGGEWGGAVLMAVEHAPDKDRGYFGSWPQVGVPAGLALATGVMALASQLDDAQFLAWGWRACFLFSAVLVIVGVYIRARIHETPAFKKVQSERRNVAVPFLEMLRTQPGAAFKGMMIRYIEGVGFNLYGVFMVGYLTQTLKWPRTTALLAITASACVSIFVIPFFGRLSDRLGRKKVFAVGALLTGMLCFPAFYLITGHPGDKLWLFLAILVPFGLVYPMIYGPEAAIFAELFQTRVRYTGVSFVYQFSGIFASGLTPIIAADLMIRSGGKPWLVCGYVLVVSLISTVAVLLIEDKAGKSIMD